MRLRSSLTHLGVRSLRCSARLRRRHRARTIRGARSVAASRAATRSGVWSASRATQQVGRRVGAHRGPRPGRASGTCRFTGTQPDRAGPGRRVPATRRSSRTISDRRSRSIRSTTPTCRTARSPRTTVIVEPGAGRPTPGRHATASRRSTSAMPARRTVREAAALHADRRRDLLRQRHDRDAPAARHVRGRSAARAAASSASSTTTGRRRSRRVVDLYRPDFFAICGCPSWAGTTTVTVYVY